jgi:hypothetical protein
MVFLEIEEKYWEFYQRCLEEAGAPCVMRLKDITEKHKGTDENPVKITQQVYWVFYPEKTSNSSDDSYEEEKQRHQYHTIEYLNLFESRFSQARKTAFYLERDDDLTLNNTTCLAIILFLIY